MQINDIFFSMCASNLLETEWDPADFHVEHRVDPKMLLSWAGF